MKRLALIVSLLLSCAGAQADLILQNTAYPRLIYMQDSTASRSPGVAGLTLTISQSKAGAAFGAITPTVTDLGGGWYSLALTAGMNDTLKSRALKITAVGADETDAVDQIVAFDPHDANMGLPRLDAAVSTRLSAASAPANWSSLVINGSGVVSALLGANEDTALTRLFGVLNATPAFTSGAFANLPNVTIGGYATGQDPATLLFAATLQGGLSLKQAQNLEINLHFDAVRTWTSSTHTAVYTWYARNAGLLTPDLTKPVMVKTTVYDSTNTQVTTQSVAVTASNLN